MTPTASGSSSTLRNVLTTEELASTIEYGRLLESALGEAIVEDGRLFQKAEFYSQVVPDALVALQHSVSAYRLRLTGDDIGAIRKSLELRRENATLFLLQRYSTPIIAVANRLAGSIEEAIRPTMYADGWLRRLEMRPVI